MLASLRSLLEDFPVTSSYPLTSFWAAPYAGAPWAEHDSVTGAVAGTSGGRSLVHTTGIQAPTVGAALAAGRTSAYFDSTAAEDFLATSVSGCLLWLRASLGLTQSGGSVSEWDDQSGSGDPNRNLVQAVGANQPTYNASDAAYGGRPSLSVAGSHWLASVGSWSQAAPYTVYLVGKITDAINSVLLGGGPATIGHDLATHKWYADDGNNYTAQSALDASAAAVVCAVFDNGGSIYVSDSQTPSGTSGSGAVQPLNPAVFGANSSGGAAAATGSGAEVIVYSSAHDAATRRTVMTGLGTIYGLSAS